MHDLATPLVSHLASRSDETHEYRRTSWNTSDENLVLPLPAGRSGVSSGALCPPNTTASATRETLASAPIPDLPSPTMSIDSPSLRYATSALGGNAIPGPSTHPDSHSTPAIPFFHDSSPTIDSLFMQSAIEQSHLLSVRGPLPDSPACIGYGLDAPAIGVLSTLVLPTVVGLFLWVSVLLSSGVKLVSQTDYVSSYCSPSFDHAIAKSMA